eukprot:15485068-Alexandrium_andersonii.AAC.1
MPVLRCRPSADKWKCTWPARATCAAACAAACAATRGSPRDFFSKYSLTRSKLELGGPRSGLKLDSQQSG